nr:hypothetical protein [Mimivirus sp.]
MSLNYPGTFTGPYAGTYTGPYSGAYPGTYPSQLPQIYPRDAPAYPYIYPDACPTLYPGQYPLGAGRHEPYYDYYAYPNVNNQYYGCGNRFGERVIPWQGLNPYYGYGNVYAPGKVGNNITYPAIIRAGSGGASIKPGRQNFALKPVRT